MTGTAAVEAVAAAPPVGRSCPDTDCQHVRTSHSINGCGEWLDDGGECPCPKTYMEV